MGQTTRRAPQARPAGPEHEETTDKAGPSRYEAYTPIFALDQDNGAPVILGLLRGSTSRSAQEENGTSTYTAHPSALTKHLNHLNRQLTIALPLLIPPTALDRNTTYIDRADLEMDTQDLRFYLGNIPHRDLEIVKGWNKTEPYPVSSLWFDIPGASGQVAPRPNPTLADAADNNRKEQTEQSRSHPPPDLAFQASRDCQDKVSSAINRCECQTNLLCGTKGPTCPRDSACSRQVVTA